MASGRFLIGTSALETRWLASHRRNPATVKPSVWKVPLSCVDNLARRAASRTSADLGQREAQSEAGKEQLRHMEGEPTTMAEPRR